MDADQKTTNIVVDVIELAADFRLTLPFLLVRRLREFEMTSSEFVLLTYILAFAEGSETVSVSLRQAEKEAALAPGTIHRAKTGLVKKGFIKITNVRNKMRTNTYDLAPLKIKLSGSIKQNNNTL